MKRFFALLAFCVALGLCFWLFYGNENQEDVSMKEIAILSVNDAHSNIDMFPQFAALVDSLRGVYPDLLLFSAGDNRTGNPVNDQYNPVNAPMIALMNKVGFDVSAVGNHEWDGNVDALRQNLQDAHFPFLCANVFIPEALALDIKPYVVIENQGVKVAVVGLLEVRHDGIPGAHPSNFTQVRFKRGIDVLPEYRFLREECDVMIALSHLGYEDDLELAQSAPYLDEIIGGHSHTLVEQPSVCNGVLVTQAGSHLKYATLSILKVKDGKVVEKSATNLDVRRVKSENPEFRAAVDAYNDTPFLNEAIAEAKSQFNTPETLGCLITDALCEMSGADFAFQNTGGVRVRSLDAGPITVKDVYTVDPFNNDVVVFTMTGEQVELFILDTYRKNGRFPSYVSGMSYQIEKDGSGREKGARISLEKGKFSKSAKYKVAINSYMASTVHIESLDDGTSQFMTSEEMVIAYLRKHKVVDYYGLNRVR